MFTSAAPGGIGSPNRVPAQGTAPVRSDAE